MGKLLDIEIIGLEGHGVHPIWGPLFRKSIEDKKI
jgi:hypothetical protein